MPPDRDPERIAHFRIVGRLGQGGMGIVYRAEDEKLRRTVALKVLPEAFAHDAERRRRFLREARSAAALTHPNIAAIHEADEDDGRVFLAMELVEGPTLREKVARGRLGVAEAVRVARGIARGLARAHAKGIVHRDLKPDNVIVDADGEPKILDFGLARLREQEQAAARSEAEGAETESIATEQGRTLGTPQYMSPEQARGAAVDGRSDVFSLGVVLYEMLAGKRPFAGASPAELLAAILRDTPEPLSDVAPDVPAALAAIVDRCLAKQPDARWPGARELAEALEAVPPSGSVKSQVGIAAATEPRSRARSVAPLALGGVTVVVAMAFALRGRAPPQPAAAPGPASASAATATRALTGWPPPRTTSAEAATLYAEALQAFRDAALSVFTDKLQRAVSLDPHFAAAHVRLALVVGVFEIARQHVAAANEARSSLDDRDRRFLALADAIFGDPSTFDPAIRAARELATAMPDDPEAQFWAAQTLEAFAPEPEVVRLLDRALQLDPKFAAAEHSRSRLALEQGDPVEMLAAADRCLAIAPGAVACLRRRADVHALRGLCRELEQDARRLIALEPNGEQGYGYLLTALASNGAPVEALREVAAKQQAAAGVEGVASAFADQNAASLAAWAGDLTQAEASLRALQKDEASLADETRHTAEWQLIEVYDEEGETAKAAAVGDDYLRRVPAWTHDGPAAGRAGALAAMRRAGRLSDAQAGALREAWLMEWRPAVPARLANGAWLWFYAGWAETPGEAREALAALPAYLPLPPSGTDPFAWGNEGRVHALAGDAERAIPLLRQSVASCGALPTGPLPVAIDWMVDAMRDRYLLGQMLEQRSDRDGACAQYAAVLARWGAAKPRSVTADRARARKKALGCR